MNEHAKLAIRALEQFKGDDLYRAKMAFRDCTPEEMAEAWCSLGTRAEVLAGYQKHSDAVDAAIAWITKKE